MGLSFATDSGCKKKVTYFSIVMTNWVLYIRQFQEQLSKMALKLKGYLLETEFEHKHIETFSFKCIQILGYFPPA